MLCSSRILVRNICVSEKLFSSGKATNRPSGKSEPNVIKSNNILNKNLFGSLLETQKERRKRLGLSKALKCPRETTSIAADEQSESTDIQNEPLEKKSRGRKPKNTLADSVTLELPAPEHVSCNDTANKSTVELRQVRTTTKTKKIKSVLGSKNELSKVDPALRPTNNIKTIDNPSNKFIFRSVEDINDTNYPLENLDKIDLLKQNYCEENVLSYSFSDPHVKEYVKYPSVSKIMEETMTAKSKLILKRWRQNMIADLGEDGFAKYSTELKARGHEFHEAVRKTLLGEAVEDCSDITRKALRSLDWMLELTSNPLAVESLIAHPKLEYKGIPDCVAMFRKVPVVIDWKLSDKPKKELKDTYEAPVQITAYIGGLNHDPNYKWGVNHGLVAVAYTSGDPCDVFLLAPKHCEIYWRYWLQRFDQFKARSHLHEDHDIDEKTLRGS